MKTKELRKIMDRAKERKAINPCLTALVICYSPGLSEYTALEICRLLGISDSYESTVRAVLRVPEEIAKLGYQLTR